MADDLVQIALQKRHLNSMIRQLKTQKLDHAESMLLATKTAMRRLRLRPDPSKAAEGVPKGSDQCDVGSFIAWTNKITKVDTEAIQQLIKIHATAAARMGG